MKIETAIKQASIILKNNFIKSSLLDSELLISKAINKNREYIILNLDKEIKEDDYLNFQRLVTERSQGKSIAHYLAKMIL